MIIQTKIGYSKYIALFYYLIFFYHFSLNTEEKGILFLNYMYTQVYIKQGFLFCFYRFLVNLTGVCFRCECSRGEYNFL